MKFKFKMQMAPSLYKDRVNKHLAVFSEAVQGLKQVQDDLATDLEKTAAEAAELKAREAELANHKKQVENHISTITTFFPTT